MAQQVRRRRKSITAGAGAGEGTDIGGGEVGHSPLTGAVGQLESKAGSPVSSPLHAAHEEG